MVCGINCVSPINISIEEEALLKDSIAGSKPIKKLVLGMSSLSIIDFPVICADFLLSLSRNLDHFGGQGSDFNSAHAPCTYS